MHVICLRYRKFRKLPADIHLTLVTLSDPLKMVLQTNYES